MWQTTGKADFLHSSHTISNNLVMWETRHSIVNWVCFKIQILLVILRTQLQPQDESCVLLELKHLFPSVGCKKQTAVSHSSTESEMISLDDGFRMDGLFALDLWDIVIEVLRSTKNNVQPKHTSIHEAYAALHSKTKTQKVERRRDIEQLSNVDYVPTNTHSSHKESQLYIFEDNEAVIKILIQGGRPTMRHVSGTHRVALDWLFDRINLEPKQNPNQIH